MVGARTRQRGLVSRFRACPGLLPRLDFCGFCSILALFLLGQRHQDSCYEQAQEGQGRDGPGTQAWWKERGRNGETAPLSPQCWKLTAPHQDPYGSPDLGFRHQRHQPGPERANEHIHFSMDLPDLLPGPAAGATNSTAVGTCAGAAAMCLQIPPWKNYQTAL